MEEKLYTRLDLSEGSRVLDAGAGSGIVASYMAERGLRVDGIDLTPLHVEEAQSTIKDRHLEEKVSVKLGDYHDLSSFEDDALDGVYTMETFVHADDPVKVLQNFYRVLKSGGVLVMHEGDYNHHSALLEDVLRLSHCQNTLKEGSYEDMLKQTGFQNITVDDLSDNVLPLWRLFGWLGAVPYDIVKALGLQNRFTNMMAGVETYRHWSDGRYISVRAEKPR